VILGRSEGGAETPERSGPNRRIFVKTLLPLALAASALAVAVPAMAQPSFDDRTATIGQRIDDGVLDGSLTHVDARYLRARLDSVERMQQRYEDDGMAGWESRDLNRRLDQLTDSVYDMRRSD
jgi:hypothetical protein